MNERVYIVTSREYYDYGIDAVFKTREDAEEFLKLFENSDDNFNIEEYEIGANYKFTGKHVYVASILTGGTVTIRNANAYMVLSKGIPSEPVISFMDSPWELLRHYEVYLCAVDAEHAKKIALDAFYKLRADKEGLTRIIC